MSRVTIVVVVFLLCSPLQIARPNTAIGYDQDGSTSYRDSRGDPDTEPNGAQVLQSAGSVGWAAVGEVAYMIVDLQLSPGVVSGPLTRCICFDLYDCQSYPVTRCQEVTFVDGVAVDVQVPVAQREYVCVEAIDPLHTLRSVSEVSFDGTFYSAVSLC